jgi:hypothetical protein
MFTSRFISGLLLAAGLGLALQPSDVRAGVTIEGPLSHERQSQPGEVYRGVISIRNTGPEPMETKVYLTDYAFSADGRNDFGPAGRLPRSNAAWIRLNKEHAVIPGSSAVNVHYEVKVPVDVRLSGSYWSMVMVEPVSARERSAPVKSKEPTAQIAQVIRYGIQIVTDIGDEGRRDLEFKNPGLQKKDGKRVFTVDAENTGDYWFSPQFWIELYDAQGNPIKKLDGEKKRIYPGTSVRLQIDLSQLPAGRYHALVAADGGGDALFGTELDLSL